MENNKNIFTNEKVYSIDELEIKQHSFCLITSKRASGKSVLVRHLIKYMFEKYEYDVIMMFSDTSQFTDDYKFIDKNLMFKTDELEEKIAKVLKIQEKNIKKDNIVNVMIILDDIKIHAKSKELINLSTMGRHFKITVILSSQYPKMLVSSGIRNNLSYVFFSDLGETALRAIYESIHVKYNFRKFDEFVNENNHDYQFILYDGMISGKDRIKVIKATEYKDLKFNK